jgi:HEAT repeat protein
LAKGLKSENSLVRQNCAVLIGQLGADGRDQVGVLEKLARSDPSAGVRDEARAALKKIGSQ